MADTQVISVTNADNPAGIGEKKKKKEDKADLSLDKLELTLYRAQLSVVRTATTTTTLGFALYKLLEEKIHEGVNGPLIRIFTPHIVALILFFSGFVALITFSFRHVAMLKKMGRFSPRFYVSGIMLVSYVILLLTLFLFIGALING